MCLRGLYVLYSIFLEYIVEVRGRAHTVNGSGHSREKQDAKHTCMGWTSLTQRTYGVDKMDTDGNSNERELENWKDEGFVWG